MSLQDLVNVSISAVSVFPTRPGFGVPLLAAYHTKWTDFARTYSSLAGMVSDGFASTDPAYKMAAAVLAQNPSVAKFMIGRLAHPGTQTVHLLLGSASALDTYTLTMVGWDGVSHKLDFASTGVVNTDAASLVTAINAATMSPVTHVAGTGPAVTLTGTPAANEQIVIDITTDGAVGAAVFKWSNDGGASFTTGVTTAASVALGATGLTANFAAGTYTTADSYTANSTLGFASASSATVTVTQIAGKLADYLNWNPSGSTSPLIVLTDVTADHSVSSDLDAILAHTLPGSWYGLALDSNSSAEAHAAATWAESNGAHLFIWNNSDTHCITSDTDDLFSVTKALAYARSGGLYAGSQLLSYGGAAWLGKVFPSNPGSLTFMYKTLAGVPQDVLSETAQANLNAKHGNYYITLAGIGVTINGWSSSGEFFDITWGIDWLTSTIQIDVFALLASSPKVPYTDLGVDMIVSVIKGDLALATSPAFQLLAATPAPTVIAPTVASQSPTDRAARNFPGITFSGRLAGAIHELTITGTVTV